MAISQTQPQKAGFSAAAKVDANGYYYYIMGAVRHYYLTGATSDVPPNPAAGDSYPIGSECNLTGITGGAKKYIYTATNTWTVVGAQS